MLCSDGIPRVLAPVRDAKVQVEEEQVMEEDMVRAIEGVQIGLEGGLVR